MHFLLNFTLSKIKLVLIMNNQFILFVTLVTLMPNKLQYVHSPEIFILSFSLRFLPSNAAKKCALGR